MPRSQYRSTNNMEKQDTLFPPNPNSTTEEFYNENYPEELQDRELKSTVTKDQNIQRF